jgi:cytochrome c biogenesis protein ResB
MKTAIYIMTLLAIMSMFILQDKLRKPVYNKMYNVWNEDTESIIIANIIMIIMLFFSFLLGYFM